jgi:hypothetical protein
MRKRGIEISINFIVIMILAIVTLAMGLIIFNMIFKSGTELEKEVSQSTKDQINRLMMTGDQAVAMPEFIKDMSIGEQYAFGLGIKNSRAAAQQFTVNVMFNFAVDSKDADKTQEAVASADIASWYFEKIGPITVNPNSLQVISIPIRPGSKAKDDWVYVFNVEVKDSNGQRYGDLQKIYARIT